MTRSTVTERRRPAPARRRPALAVAVIGSALVIGLGAAPAEGQVVRGTLVEERSGAPVPGGSVALLDSGNQVVDSTRATAEGRFTLRAPGPGTYALHFTSAGYASVPSERIIVAAGQTVDHRFAVPLISGAAIRRMTETIDIEKRLQSDLTELCGERPRPGETGILVGAVRRQRGEETLAGAIVRVELSGPTPEQAFHRATVTSANGVYVICNVPAGSGMMRTELSGYRTDEGPFDVRAGEIAWYDVYLRPR
jgi:hypothetical protein